MSTYRVHFSTTASASVKVKIDDDGMESEQARDTAIEEAYQNLPSGICAQCSGWLQSWSLDLGEFELDDKDAVEKVEE